MGKQKYIEKSAYTLQTMSGVFDFLSIEKNSVQWNSLFRRTAYNYYDNFMQLYYGKRQQKLQALILIEEKNLWWFTKNNKF